MVPLDKRRLNSNFIILKETEEVGQLFSESTTTRVKDADSKDVRLKVKEKKI